MKKGVKSLVLIAILLLSIMVVAACNDSTLLKVKFDSNGGSSIKSIKVISGALVVEPTAPTREGFTFNGWYADSECLTSWIFASNTVKADTTLYASWLDNNVKSYTITYKDGAEILFTKKVAENMFAENIIPTRDEYTFNGWQLETVDFNFATPITTDLILVAKWTLSAELFTFTVSDNSATITGLKDKTVTKLFIPSKISGHSVTSIGGGAFYGCSSLASITIPSSVTSIGMPNMLNMVMGFEQVGAFYDCNSLTSINVDITNTTYKSIDGDLYSKDGAEFLYYCNGKKDTSFTIPTSVTSIGESAFRGCSSLTSIAIPTSVTSIGLGAFEGCTNLTFQEKNNCLYLNNWLICVKDTNVTTFEIANGTLGIYGVAFAGCRSLTSITIPASVTSIGDGAFAYCRSLTSIIIPDGVTSIGDLAFTDCSSLTSITIPTSVTSIGNFAFGACHNLTSIDVDINNTTYKSINGDLYSKDGAEFLYYCNGKKDTSFAIPTSVTSIGLGAFGACHNLTSITIPTSVTSIGESAFYFCSRLTSVTIPNSVTNIGRNVFRLCSSLTSITIPTSVTSIGERVFGGCSSLTSIIIPDGVTSIGDLAFTDCSSLTSITIPTSVTSIGEYAFYGCSGLTNITIPTSVTRIGGSAFAYCSSLTIYCEATSKPAGWDVNWNLNSRPVVWGHK